jgi:hypothetical protein
VNVWRAAALKFQLPDIAGWFAPFAMKSLAPQHQMPLHAGPIRSDGFPVARVGQGHHRRHAAALHQWRVVELGEGAAHGGTRLAGPFGDRAPMRIGHVPARLNSIHLSSYVESVLFDSPLRCLLRANRTRPPEANYTRADRDPEPACSSSEPRRSRPCAQGWADSNKAAAEATKSGLGNRRPRAFAADSSAPTPSSTVSRTLLAHITSPSVPAGTRPTPLPPSDRPLSLSRPAALAASGTRGLPASAAPAVFRLAVRVVVGPRVDCSAVVRVERTVGTEMLGIGYLLPGSPRRASLSDGQSRVPRRECCHRVRFVSDRRTGSLRETRSARRI